jgi:murein DD-endopeptidase MepM/ murein hydrolase activator NlpD
MDKKMCRRQAHFLVFVMRYRPTTYIAVALPLMLLTAPAQAGLLDEIRASISRLWSQKADKQGDARAARAKAQALNAKAHALHDQLEATQQALQKSNDEYYNYWKQMRRTEARIVETRHRVHIVTARYNRRRILFGRRLAAMQRSGKLSYLQMFLGSRTLSDLTRRAQLFDTVTQRDAQLQADIRADKTELEQENVKLQHEWHQRNRLQRAANRERLRIANAEKERRTMINRLYSSRNALLAYSVAEQQSSRELESMIGDLSSRREALSRAYDEQAARERAARRAAPGYTERRVRRRRIARRVTRTRYVRSAGGELKPMKVSELKYITREEPVEEGGLARDEHFEGDGHRHGDWFRPVNGRVSSRYGVRFHPVLRRRKLHTGEDVAARQGTPFRAARNGRVLWSGWKKAYGNTIIIDHGDGTTSLYGHASKLSVRQGQPVRAGEYIGNVGSTGWSTGPHLHFEVRKNGKPVNPRGYVR